MTDLRTPDEWSEHFLVTVLDPDGWRSPMERDWDEPLTSESFLERLAICTIALRAGSPLLNEWVAHG